MNNENPDFRELRPFPRFLYTLGELPTSYLMSMTYEEQLIWLCKYLEDDTKAIIEIQEFLKDLNLQDEVNNKLDEMALDGTLAEIINQEIFGELDSRVTQNTSDIEDLQEAVEDIDASITTEIVTFGDSWTDSTVPQAVWPQYVADALRLNLHNYGDNGAGYVLPSDDLIQTQVNTAINDTSYNHNLVKYIVFSGGINDYRRGVTVSDLRDEIIELHNACKVAFPNAKIIYVNNFQYPYTQVQSEYWYTLQYTLSTYGVQALNQDGFFKERFFLDNKYHLTVSGQKVYGSNIIAALSGGQIKNDGVFVDFADSKGYLYVRRDDNILNYYILFQNLLSTDTEVTGTQDLCWVSVFDEQYLGSINISYTPAIIDFDGEHNKIALARQDTSKTKICMNGSLCLHID